MSLKRKKEKKEVSRLSSVVSFASINQLLEVQTRRPPSPFPGRPLDVRLGIYLESLGNFRSTEMVGGHLPSAVHPSFVSQSFDVDLYVYMSWMDVRLRHRGPDFVMVNDDMARKRMWWGKLLLEYDAGDGIQVT